MAEPVSATDDSSGIAAAGENVLEPCGREDARGIDAVAGDAFRRLYTRFGMSLCFKDWFCDGWRAGTHSRPALDSPVRWPSKYWTALSRMHLV